MFELKHVSLDESVLDVLVCPGDEQFVVVVSLGVNEDSKYHGLHW